MRIMFLGGPGSGKSTIGTRLANDLKWPWISSGAILRESKEPWVVEKLKTAQLFDDDMVSGLVLSRLTDAPNAIIDCFPRTFRQAEIMMTHGEKVDVIVELQVPLEEVQKRLSERGRDQDVEDIIEERYEMYERNKDEIVAYLIGNGAKIVKIDGTGTQDEVYAKVVNGLKEVAR
jgi:adenylate kinase